MEYFMAFARNMNLETRTNEINAMLSRGSVKELLKFVFTGCEEKEDRFQIVLNGAKYSMTYKEVQNYNYMNKTKFKLKYTKIGQVIKNRNFDKMLELYKSGELNLNMIRELMKEADIYREFV